MQWISRRVGHGRESGEPYAAWAVKLSCGHCCSSSISSVEWSPEKPPELDVKKIEILRGRLSAEWKDLDDDTIRDLREELEHKGSLVSDPALEEK